MPLGVPFKDSKGRRGFTRPADSISISQHNRQKIRFRTHQTHFTLEIPEGISLVRITNRNAIRLAEWILDNARHSSGKGQKTDVAAEG